MNHNIPPNPHSTLVSFDFKAVRMAPRKIITMPMMITKKPIGINCSSIVYTSPFLIKSLYTLPIMCNGFETHFMEYAAPRPLSTSCVGT